jgi:hypothetical protein
MEDSTMLRCARKKCTACFCKNYNATCQLDSDFGPISSLDTSCGTSSACSASSGTKLHTRCKLWYQICILLFCVACGCAIYRYGFVR